MARGGTTVLATIVLLIALRRPIMDRDTEASF
jgi:hypothetical protein